jgi:hypothetical protein
VTSPKFHERVYKTKVLKLEADHVVRYATAFRVWWKGDQPSRLSLATGEHFRVLRVDHGTDSETTFIVERDIEPEPSA